MDGIINTSTNGMGMDLVTGSHLLSQLRFPRQAALQHGTTLRRAAQPQIGGSWDLVEKT